jgi:hypothetical protein
MEPIIVTCPHCNDIVLIKKLNCIFKNNFKQLHPHTPKYKCDIFYKKGLIFGCGKPFMVNIENNKYSSIICDYI